MLHYRIPRHHDFLQFMDGLSCTLQDFFQQLPDLRPNFFGQLLQAAFPLHGVLNPADDIAAVRRLQVPCTSFAQKGAGCPVIHPNRHCGGSQIHRRAPTGSPRLTWGQRNGFRQNNAAHSCGQVNHISPFGNQLAGQSGYTVHRNPAFSAPPPAAASRRNGVSRAPQHRQQRFTLFQRHKPGFTPLPNLNT